MIFGLIGSANLKNTIKKMSKFQCDDYLIVKKEMSMSYILTECLQKRDIKVIELLNLSDLEMSNSKLLTMFEELLKHDIKIDILEKEVELSSEDYFKIVYHTLKRDYDFRSKIQREKLKDAKNKGVLLGRPSLTKAEIEEIKFLRENHKLTYREISKRTGISLGTVSKYCTQNGSAIL